jgi:hypothetical protein
MLKTGYKTSEFWITSITAIGTIINQSGLLGGAALPIEAIATIAGIVASYVISRGVAKVNK